MKNSNDSIIYSKYGDIVIDSLNVNLNGLIYAPFGNVEIKAQNLNLNNIVIIIGGYSLITSKYLRVYCVINYSIIFRISI